MVKTFSTADLLTAGKATFTLHGKGRRWTFRIQKVENSDPARDPIFFVSLLTGQDNENDYTYAGIYQPWATSARHTLRLTRASKCAEDTEFVRGFRWAIGLIHNGRENEIAGFGFEITWAEQCQRCGKELTVPSSCHRLLGPTCAEKLGFGD